jgi:hypothetical protein
MAHWRVAIPVDPWPVLLVVSQLIPAIAWTLHEEGDIASSQLNRDLVRMIAIVEYGDDVVIGRFQPPR